MKGTKQKNRSSRYGSIVAALRRVGSDVVEERLHSPVFGYESIVFFSKMKWHQWQSFDQRSSAIKLIRTRSSDAHNVKSDRCVHA